MAHGLGFGHGLLARRGRIPPIDGSIMPQGGKYIFSTRRVRAGYAGSAMRVARYYTGVTGDTSAVGTNTITGVTPTTNLANTVMMTGAGIPAGARITSVVGGTVTLDQNLVAGGAAGTAITLGGINDFADINYLGSGELDTPTLLTFVGASGTGKLIRWHNQSDLAGGFLTLVNTSSPPEIVTSGLLQLMNGKPAIYAHGGLGTIMSIPATLSPYLEISAAWQSLSDGLPRGLYVEHSTSIAVNDGMIFQTLTDPAWAMRRLGGTIHQHNSGSSTHWVGTTPTCVQMRYAPDAQHVRHNGTILLGTATSGTLVSNTGVTNDLHVFGRTGAVHSRGFLGELVIWENGVAPSRLANAHANSRLYWGTP